MSLSVDKSVGSRGVKRAALPPGPREGRGLARSPILDSRFSAHSNPSYCEIGSSGSCLPCH